MTREHVIEEVRIVDRCVCEAIDEMELHLLASAMDRRGELLARLVSIAEDGDRGALLDLSALSRATEDLQLRLAGRLQAIAGELDSMSRTQDVLGAYGRTG